MQKKEGMVYSYKH